MNRVKDVLPILIIVLLFSIRSASAFTETIVTETKELESVLEIAENENPQIIAALERLKQAHASVALAESSMGPHVTGSFSWKWNDEKKIAPVQDSTGTLMGTALLEPEKLYAASLALEQVLYAGGSLHAQKRAQRLLLNAEIAVAERTYQSVIFRVRLAFHAYIRARAQFEVTESNRIISEAHLRQAQVLYKNGIVSKGDILRAQVVLSQAKLEKIRAQNDVDVCWAQLERHVGVSLERQKTRVETSHQSTALKSPHDYGEHELINIALAKRPEIKRFANQSKSAEELARAEEGKKRPKVVLRAEAMQMGEDFWPDQENNAAVSLNLQWRLYDHHEIRARVAHSRAVAREFMSLLNDSRLQIHLEVKQAALQLSTAKMRKEVVLYQMAQAQEDFRIAQKRYQSHVGTHLDVLSAQDALVRSKTQWVDVFFDIATAEASLAYALGIDKPSKISFEESLFEKKVYQNGALEGI